MTTRYMLDTNTASFIIKEAYPALRKKLQSVPMAQVCVSAITQGELLLGVAKRPEAKNLKLIVHEFLLRVDILPWDSDAATCYAQLQAACEQKGTPLGNLDMLIAAHAIATKSVLVTHDRAFYRIKPSLDLVDWTKAH